MFKVALLLYVRYILVHILYLTKLLRNLKKNFKHIKFITSLISHYFYEREASVSAAIIASMFTENMSQIYLKIIFI
jgi:hypothetical protein